MTEFWDLVDESGNKSGVKWERKNHDFIPDGLYHPAVEVWVRVGDRLLLSRRHPDKTDGLKYDCPGGAVVSGESFSLGAIRELYEEVGIDVKEGDLILLGAQTHGCCFAISYLVRLDALPTITLQPNEVVGYLLIDPIELEGMKDQVTSGTYRRFLAYKDRIVSGE